MKEQIEAKCDEIKEMLVEKNRRYGNSALDPVRIFSKASPEEQILVRLDDKLSRLRSAQGDEDEDVIKDLVGYLVLLMVYREDASDESKPPPGYSAFASPQGAMWENDLGASRRKDTWAKAEAIADAWKHYRGQA